MAVEIDISSLEQGIARLRDRLGERFLVQTLDLVAEELLNLAIEVIPTDQGTLGRTGTTSVNLKKKEVIFGFNSIYAAFQDAPGKKSGDKHIVKPVNKDWLFIPLTEKARRVHRPGNDPNNEGLLFGGFASQVGPGPGGPRPERDNSDYVLAKKAIIPIKAYGSNVGPNNYFSGTLSRNKDFALSAIARGIRTRLSRGNQ
jgi:hypothetical protein